MVSNTERIFYLNVKCSPIINVGLVPGEERFYLYLEMYLFNANVKIIFPLSHESLPFSFYYSPFYPFCICSGEKVKNGTFMLS